MNHQALPATSEFDRAGEILVAESQRLARESTVEGIHSVFSAITREYLGDVGIAILRTGDDGRPIVCAGSLEGEPAAAAIAAFHGQRASAKPGGEMGHVLAGGRLLVVPIEDGDTVVALLCLTSDVATLRLEDLSCLRHLLPQLAICLRHAALLDTLERMVTQEMTRVVESESSIQLVLDSMAEGLLVCELSGALGTIRSKAVEQWLGPAASEATLWSYLFPDDPSAAKHFQVSFALMAEDVLPFEVASAQTPSLVKRGDRTYQLGFRPVHREGVFSAIVVTIKDITLELARERRDRMARELPAVMERLLGDREGFRAFVEEAEGLIGSVIDPSNPAERQRALHTLKGNSAMFGFCHFAQTCHELEERMAIEPAEPTADSLAQLESNWRDAIEPVRRFSSGDSITITVAEHQWLVAELERRSDPTQILAVTRTWTCPPLATVIEMLGATAQRLAGRVGKKLEVRLDHNGLRLPDPRLRPFLASLVHVVRNAVDHGIELPETRVAAGKPPTGLLKIQCRFDSGSLLVALSDDGAGIDWDELARRGAALGMRDRDPVDLLFADGVSTRSESTDISGRGVGLAATRSLCQQVGGRIEVHSTRGRGTEFRFSLPLAGHRFGFETI